MVCSKVDGIKADDSIYLAYKHHIGLTKNAAVRVFFCSWLSQNRQKNTLTAVFFVSPITLWFGFKARSSQIIFDHSSFFL